jgi:hypothetical protein
MHKNNSSRSILINISVALTLLVVNALALQAQTNSEPGTARYFESIRKSPPQMLAFLRKMPKGADLHSHLSGAIYAESYIQWAANNGLCVHQVTTVLSQPPCDQTSGQLPVSQALSNPGLYGKLIDSWSMRFGTRQLTTVMISSLMPSANSGRPPTVTRGICWLKWLHVRPGGVCFISN